MGVGWRWHGLVTGLISLCVAGCSHPSDKAISKFAESTVAISSIAASASDLQSEIGDKTEVMFQAPTYAGLDTGRKKQFPPLPGSYSDDAAYKQEWAARVALLKSVGAYAKALAEANDPALGKSVGETTANLSIALGNFQSAINASNPARAAYLSERTQVIGGIIADAATFATEIYTATKLREIMAATHPKLETARDLIKQDLAVVSEALRKQRNDYQRARQRKLDLHANDGRLDSVARYNIYIAASAEVTALNVRLELIKDASTSMDGMVAVHAKVMASSDDMRDLTTFTTFVGAMAEKAKKLQDLERANRG